MPFILGLVTSFFKHNVHWLLYLAIAVAVAVPCGSFYYMWKSNIENQTRLEFNQTQLQQALKDQNDAILKQQQIMLDQQAIIKALQASNAEVVSNVNDVNVYLHSLPTAEQQALASEAIRKTFELLNQHTPASTPVKPTPSKR